MFICLIVYCDFLATFPCPSWFSSSPAVFPYSLRLKCLFTVYCIYPLSLLLMLPDPFRGWGMAKKYKAPEAGQLPKAWTRGGRETESGQRASGVES